MDRSTAGSFRLNGKVSLVTGGAGHLGSSMSSCLAESGAHVYVVGRDRTNCARHANALAGRGLSAYPIGGDVTSPEDVAKIVDTIRSRHNRLDVLVNNAHSGMPGTMEQSSPAQYLHAIDVGVGAAATLVNECRELLANAVVEADDASVINIASMYGMVSPDPRIYGSSGMNNPPYYGAAKAALIQYTRYAACHLGPHKIRVNAVSPGPFPPEKVVERSPEFASALIGKVPLGRLGHPDDVAGAVVFLASPAARFITGINLPVDGGWTAW